VIKITGSGAKKYKVKDTLPFSRIFMPKEYLKDN